jgi:hypothetical protein
MAHHKALNYKDNGLHKTLTKDVNGNLTSCIYYKRKDENDVLTKKVVEETMVNTYDGATLTKVVLTRTHYRGFPEIAGCIETEINIFN